ncbi:molybdopterin-guanine dinucleotide biosynthesis protein B [Paenibacillus chibensis]|uniref:Molybdopterin-guanine dinucleotide biosynthesis protein B n=1 Tax=Paenibacillus chibensis TaxID=59846 RepID=A0ABU6PT52_9BACL|nr:molybdopterin-guanine dinucleotide biosynthesis protein B [Paenibacillus chibensis]
MSSLNHTPDHGGFGRPLVCQIVGYKNSGKTTLVCALVEKLKTEGYRVAVIKHDAHDFEMDHPGTDSFRHREAGAEAIAIVSPRKTAVIREKSLPLDVIIRDFAGFDVILVEGFKQENYSKLVLVRRTDDFELIHALSSVKAVVAWMSAEDVLSAVGKETMERLNLFQIDELERIYGWLKQQI